MLGLLVLLLLGVRWLRPPDLHGTVLQAPDLPADFTLTDQHGDPVRLSDFQGKWTLVYFGYTYCPDVCPTTLADLKTALAALGRRADDAQVLFVSLDPERDTPERIAAYLHAFDDRFVGLTGDTAAVDAAATEFGVYYKRNPPSEGGGYTVDHTSTVILLDPEGRMRMVIPYGVSGADMAADLTWFMRRG